MADAKTLDLLLRKARSHGDFTDRPVAEETLRAAHELMKMGPTSANSQPARFVYLRSRESREKLRPALAATNLEKTLKAPLVCIVAHDLRFWENLPRMFHNPDAINWFRDKGAHTEITAFRNGTLQGAYYLLAGLLYLAVAPQGEGFSPWAMGAMFGAGQSLAAGVLWWSLERNHAWAE